MHRAQIFGQMIWKGRESGQLGGHDNVEENGQTGGSVDLVQKMLWLRTTENERTIDELLQAGASGRLAQKKAWKNVETYSGP